MANSEESSTLDEKVLVAKPTVVVLVLVVVELEHTLAGCENTISPSFRLGLKI